jgi:hypothetical protein
MPTTIDSAGITFNDTTSLTSANIGTAQLVNGSVIASKLGTTEQKQICKAWVNFDGTNAFSPNPSTTAIRSSYNVSSVTKNGTGDYTVNFTTPMADANYNVSGSVVSSDGTTRRGMILDLNSLNNTSTPLLTTSARIRTIYVNSDPQPGDTTIVTLSIFGN